MVNKSKPLDVVTLLSLPDQLRKTAVAILKLGKATDVRVARETGRKRSIETKLLKQLVKMGYIKFEKEGSNTYFNV